MPPGAPKHVPNGWQDYTKHTRIGRSRITLILHCERLFQRDYDALPVHPPHVHSTSHTTFSLRMYTHAITFITLRSPNTTPQTLRSPNYTLPPHAHAILVRLSVPARAAMQTRSRAHIKLGEATCTLHSPNYTLPPHADAFDRMV